jgi:hypothetical protein
VVERHLQAVIADAVHFPHHASVATIGQDGWLRIWDNVTGEETSAWPLISASAPSKLAASGGSAAACAFQDGTVRYGSQWCCGFTLV